MRFHRMSVCLSLAAALLAGCGGSSSSGPESPSSGVGGLAGHGAPIVEGKISVFDANGAPVSTGFSTKLGEWKLELNGTEKEKNPFPWVIKGEGAGVPTVWSIVFENEVGVTGKSININPFTTAALVVAGVKIGDGKLDPADLSSLKTQTQSSISAAGEKLTSILASVLVKMPSPPPSGNIFELLRTTPFWGNATGLDAVLDTVPVRVTEDGKINIQVPTLSASVTLDTASTQPVEQQVTAAKTKIDEAVKTAGTLLENPPSLLAFDVQSSWGSAADSWAGFTGAATFLATKDYGNSPVIKFNGKGFPAAGWWGATAIYDKATGEITLTLPEWTKLSRGQTHSIGFNGTASKETFEAAVKTASGCRINGEPCVITFGPAKSSDKGTLSTAAYFSTYGSFFKNAEKNKEDVEKKNKETGEKTNETANNPNKDTGTSGGGKSGSDKEFKPNTETGSGGNTNNQAVSFLVTASSSGGWSNGFSGNLTIKNTSSASIPNWSLRLPVAEGAFSGAPAAWNGNATYANGTLTITPASWANQSLAAGETWSSGFNGGFAEKWLAVPTSAGNVTFKADASLISLKAAQTSSTPTPTPKPAPLPDPTPAPTPSGPQNWEKPSSTNVTDTALNPCNAVLWGKVESVSQGCLELMETHQFGGPKHTNGTAQIPLTNGKPTYEAFGYLVEWSIYERSFGVENVSAAQYSKLLYSFLRLMPDGSLKVTDPWASMDKDDTGSLLGLKPDPFSSTWDNQDRGIMKRLMMLKARFPHLKTAFSVGGWTLSGQFASVAADDVKRKKFIDSSIDFANKFGFDGIDIDWEYPVVGGNTDAYTPGVSYSESNPGYAGDAANFTKLLRDFRQAINDKTTTNRSRTKSGKIELSIAVGLGPKTIDALNFADFIDYVDTVNLMAYDFNGGWSRVVSHSAPMYDNNGQEGSKKLPNGFDQSEWNNHDAVLNILWNLKNQRGTQDKLTLGKGRGHRGDGGDTKQETRETLLSDATLAVYRRKLVLGVPFYGRIWSSTETLAAGDINVSPWFTGSAATMGSFENSVLDSKDVIYARDNQISNIKLNGRQSKWPEVQINAADIHWDPKACASLIKTAGHIMSFDDEDAIYHKAKYVREKGLGGVMVWEVDGDTADGKLAKSFIAGMRAGSTPPLGKTCMHQP